MILIFFLYRKQSPVEQLRRPAHSDHTEHGPVPGGRLALGRAQLPDRAPPLPDHAPAQPAAVLRVSRKKLFKKINYLCSLK